MNTNWTNAVLFGLGFCVCMLVAEWLIRKYRNGSKKSVGLDSWQTAIHYLRKAEDEMYQQSVPNLRDIKQSLFDSELSLGRAENKGIVPSEEDSREIMGRQFKLAQLLNRVINAVNAERKRSQSE